MTVLLVFGLFVVIASAHNITLVDVPRYGDPRHPTPLACHYRSERNDPPLHSVKWYRGNNEIFRYTPGQQPPTRTFNMSTGNVVRGSCDQHSCIISVALPKIFNTRVSYTCEVSTEGPRFAVVKETKNLTVAVIMEEDPKILGIPATVQMGENLLLNCTTPPAMPPANIVWYIDGKPQNSEPWVVNKTQASGPDEGGLRTSWRSLPVRVASAWGAVAVRCEATQPTWPPYSRAAQTNIVVARSPHLSMFIASGSSMKIQGQGFIFGVLSAVHLLCKYSAFSELESKLF